jgi:predicted RNase H-like HicB family nuclease
MSTHIVYLDQYTLPLEITGDAGGYVAVCPVWKDCFAQGDSIEATLYEAKQVAISLIELYEEEKMQIPLKKVLSKKTPSRFSIDVDVFSTRYA